MKTEQEDSSTSQNKIPNGTVEANNNNHNNNDNKIRNNLEENGSTVTCGTTIQDFYAGQSVFITGGTGFVGKILVEKLLRSCPEISMIYLLVRNKKGKSMEDRIEELFNNSFYDRLREMSPKFRHKIVGIKGNCSVRGLGISSTDREHLLREVTIVFHSAATVRFNEQIDTALAINVGGTLDMIELCKRMDRLKAFIHVSTAYANCHLSRIEESFYPHTTKYEDLVKTLKGLGDREIQEMTPKILGVWPNTYTFTKAMAEVVAKERSKGLSMGIFRPASVISCAYEPIPGWIDNFYGPTGTLTAIVTGIIRSMQFSPTSRANIVPADFTANALIASAWDVANQFERRDDKMLIYNYVATVDYSATWEQYCRTCMLHGKEFPLSEAKWAMHLSVHNNNPMSILGRIFLHYIPAIFVDFYRICQGYPPKVMKKYLKIEKSINVIKWFCNNDWTFTNNNVVSMWQRLDAKDQQIFRFSIKDLDWNNYYRNYMKGIKIYLLKDDMRNLEASKKRARRFILMHETIKALIFMLLFWILWKIGSAIFF